MILTVYITEEQHEYLRKVAYDERISMSEVIRRLLEEMMDKDKEDVGGLQSNRKT